MKTKSNYNGLIAITEHNRAEWIRMAADARTKDRCILAQWAEHLATTSLSEIGITEFDSIQASYRQWLNHGFKA